MGLYNNQLNIQDDSKVLNNIIIIEFRDIIINIIIVSRHNIIITY